MLCRVQYLETNSTLALLHWFIQFLRLKFVLAYFLGLGPTFIKILETLKQ